MYALGTELLSCPNCRIMFNENNPLLADGVPVEYAEDSDDTVPMKAVAPETVATCKACGKDLTEFVHALPHDPVE